MIINCLVRPDMIHQMLDSLSTFLCSSEAGVPKLSPTENNYLAHQVFLPMLTVLLSS